MTTVELAFDVGDTLYYVNEFRPTPRIEEYMVDSITIRATVIEFWFMNKGTSGYFNSTNLGECIFQTKEQAEIKLKEILAGRKQ